MTNAVIYARFSSVGQNEQTIDGQIRVCREYAEREGLSVIGVYDKDKAKSASKETEKRKDLQRMFADAETGAFQYIIVYKMDRFARNRNESRIFKSELAKHEQESNRRNAERTGLKAQGRAVSCPLI